MYNTDTTQDPLQTNTLHCRCTHKLKEDKQASFRLKSMGDFLPSSDNKSYPLKPDEYTAKILGIDLTPDSAGVTRELHVPGNMDKFKASYTNSHASFKMDRLHDVNSENSGVKIKATV